MPLSRLAPGQLRWIAACSATVWALALVPFIVLTDAARLIQLQLAGSEARAREIVGGWSTAQQIDLAFLQGIDYLQLVAYGLLLSVAAVWASRRYSGRAARWGPLIAWLALAAAAFDAIENIGITIMIRGAVNAPVPTITTAFAIAKFSMFLIVVPYVLASLPARRGAGAVAST